MSKTVRQSDWATVTLMEAPFWRNGMTPEEYEMETICHFGCKKRA